MHLGYARQFIGLVPDDLGLFLTCAVLHKPYQTNRNALLCDCLTSPASV